MNHYPIIPVQEIRCGTCGRKHPPRICHDSPKSADDFAYVAKVRRQIDRL